MQGPHSQSNAHSWRFPAVRYAVAVAIIGAAVVVADWVQLLIDADVLLLVGVVLAAWFSGLRPALVAAVLATLALDYFFAEPFYTLGGSLTTIPRLAVFIGVAVLFAAAGAKRRSAERALKEVLDDLDVKVRERTVDLTRANEQLADQYAITREQANLLDLTHDTIFVRDVTNVIRYWNRGAERLYGWTRDQAIGQVAHELLQTVFPEPMERIVRRLQQDGRWEGELVHTKRDGSRVVVASRWSQQCDEHGVLIGVLETNNDITERKQAEAELRESERRHRHIFQATSVSIWEEDFSRVKAAIEDVKARGVTDVREYLRRSPEFVEQAIALVRIVDVNEATLALFGAGSKRELLGSLHKVFTPETREVFLGELVALADGRASYEAETVLQKLNGERIVTIYSVSFPPADAAFDDALVSILDITDRKRAEQQLEELAGRLIDAQEQERSRIGRELHDHISQMLGVLTIRIDQMRAEEVTPPPVAATLAELRESAREITQDIHDLSHRLHSSALDYLGLVPALQRLAAEFSSRHGVSIEFTHASLPSPLPTDVALCLFRVTEEGLTNIVKHSHSRSARVHASGSASGIRLTIEDSGTGFDTTTLEHRAGLGFISMRERLRVLGGTLRIHSSPAGGTRVEAIVPAHSLTSPTADVTARSA